MPGDPRVPVPSPPPDVIPNPVHPPTPQEAPRPVTPPDIPAPGPDVIREPEPDDIPRDIPAGSSASGHFCRLVQLVVVNGFQTSGRREIPK
jgi:hypothetical protein